MEWTDIAFVTMFLTGMAIGLYLYMSGGSQVYFVCATYPVLLFEIGKTFEKNEILESIKFKILAFVLIIWGGYLTIAHPAWQPMIGYASVGRYNFIDAQQGKWSGEGYVSQSEYEILEYIKEKIPEDASILYVNERNKIEDKWLIAGVIAEHKLQTVNKGEIISRSELDKCLGDDYDFCVMNNDWITTDDAIVFSNENWAIIKVRDFQTTGNK